MSGVWGVMQGRFTDKGGFYPQQFPWTNWEQEFFTAREYGVDCIEWMFNGERYEDNPIWTKDGRRHIKAAVRDSSVAVNSVCANYYMEHPLSSDGAMDILDRLLDAGEEVGVRHVTLPLFGASEITDVDILISLFQRIRTRLSDRSIDVYFESDMPLDVQLAICDGAGNDRIGLCYDVGNAAGNGFDYISDVKRIIGGGYGLELHFKDKKPHGNSVMLGQGSVDFPAVLDVVRDHECLRVFESFFGCDAVKDTAKNIGYIRGMLDGKKGSVCGAGERGPASP